MLCQLCQLDKPLIEAHIIPRTFFRLYGDDRGPAKVLSNKRGVFPKRVRTGFYDSEILCADCDRRLGVWDQYGSDLFIRGLDSLDPFPSTLQPIAYVKPQWDFLRLRMFLLSVLWRAGISKLAMFDRVKLGPYEARLHDLITRDDPGGRADFRTVLSVFTVRGSFHPSGVPIQDPFRERWNGASAYRLSLGSVTAYIKVDPKPYPASLEQMALEEGRPLYFIQRNFEESAEADVARAILRSPQNHRAFPKRPGEGDPGA